MNMKNDTLIKEYKVCVATDVTADFFVKATSAEEARQIVSKAFGFSNGSNTDDTLNRMHSYRHAIEQLSPETTVDKMECFLMHHIWVGGEKVDRADEDFSTLIALRPGDDYDLDPEDLSMCDCCETCVCYGECSCCDEDSESEDLCLLYLLGQPAELIPMSAVEECSAELGTQLAHECIPDTALFITYNPCSILDVEDARYLIAPALVYGLVDNEPAPMTDEECVTTQKILSDRTVTLTADGEEFHALKLWD